MGFQEWHMKSPEVRECPEFRRIEVMEVKEFRENFLKERSERYGGQRGLPKKIPPGLHVPLKTPGFSWNAKDRRERQGG